MDPGQRLLRWSDRLDGRRISPDEASRLERFLSPLGAAWLAGWMERFRLTGCKFDSSEFDLPSGLSLTCEWMSPDEMIEEATEVFPGCGALPLGYWPLCTDLDGTGDQTFLGLAPGTLGKVFVIPHDCLEEDGSLPPNSPILMLEDVDEIFEFFVPSDEV